MWQLSRAIQRPGRHAGAQEKLLQNEIHMQEKWIKVMMMMILFE